MSPLRKVYHFALEPPTVGTTFSEIKSPTPKLYSSMGKPNSHFSSYNDNKKMMAEPMKNYLKPAKIIR